MPGFVNVAKRRLNNFKQNLKQVAERGENALDNERARLFRQYEAIKQEVRSILGRGSGNTCQIGQVDERIGRTAETNKGD